MENTNHTHSESGRSFGTGSDLCRHPGSNSGRNQMYRKIDPARRRKPKGLSNNNAMLFVCILAWQERIVKWNMNR